MEIAVEAGRKAGARVDEKPQPDTAHEGDDGHDESRRERARKAIAGETVRLGRE